MPKPSHLHVCLSLLVVALFFAGCQSTSSPPPGTTGATTKPAPSLERFEYHAMKLGSDYNLVLYAADKASADAAAKAAEAEIDRLEMVFSDYKPESEIGKLSRMTDNGPMNAAVPISDDLYEVLWAAQVVAYETDGAFDVTVGPYVQLWRRSRRQQQLPAPERLAEAAPAVGYKKLKLQPWSDEDAAPGGELGREARHDVDAKAQLLAPKMRLDVGAIATGYMSDRVLVVLRERGITSAICDLSGDLAVGDPPPDRHAWRIAVRSLTEPEKTAEYLDVANCGVSTSGDTYRFVEIDGVRYSHIVDSKSGLGLTRSVGATVVASGGMAADVLATVTCVIGSEKAVSMLEAEGAEGKIVEVVGGKPQTRMTKGYGAMKAQVE